MEINGYRISQELGRGSFGVTYLGTRISDGLGVAIKTIDIDRSTAVGLNIDSIREEVETLKELSSPQCSRYIACYYDSFVDNFNDVPTMFIVSEYINGGSLTKYIAQYSGNLPPSYLWPLMNQLMLGVKYMHDQGFAHRDLKPDNVLITNNYELRIIDVGTACVARCRRDSCNNTCKGGWGTFLYEPPEFFNGTRFDSLESSKAHDIWSLAMIFFEMTNGSYQFPFDFLNSNRTAALSNEEVIANILRAPYISSNYQLDDGRTNLYLNSLVIPDWRQRPTIDIVILAFMIDVLSIVWS